jgi:HlyD family secretion protein
MTMIGMRALLLATLALVVCGDEQAPPAVETVAPGKLVLSVQGAGELKSAKATPLRVPGSGWSQRQLVWMLPEGSFVKKGDVLARFSAAEGEQELAQALIDLRRNALSRAAKESDLQAGQARVAVDLSQVAVQLGIAERYAGADLSTMARNEVLDAVQDAEFLHDKQDTLQWKRGQSSTRGAAELAVLDAQRATYDINAKTRQADLDALELRAPNDGVLMLATNWSGEKPIVGAALRSGFEYGSLPDASAMEVEIALPQIEAQGVKVGNAVELFPVGRPGQKIVSKLSWVASAAKVRNNESPVKYLSMKAPIPVAAIRGFALVPGQRMQVRVVLLRAEQVLSVANVAVQGEDSRSYVQVRNGSGFRRREVKLGVRGTARSQVLTGLRAGDQVLLTPAADESMDKEKGNGPEVKADA